MESWIDDELQSMPRAAHPPRRRALVGITLAVIAGTATGICAKVSAVWFLGVGAFLLLPLFVLVQHRWSVGLLMVATFCLVAAHARLATGGRSALSLAAHMARPMEYLHFVAVATEDAVPQPPRAGRADGWVMMACVEGLNRDGQWRRVDDRLRIVIRGGAPAHGRLPRYGERWRMRGLVRANVPRRTGLFTLPENEAIVDSDRLTFVDDGQGNPLVAWCMKQRHACREILGRGLEDFPDQRGVVQSLLMGYRADLPRALRRDFAATGTVHIFAISGAHVGMVTVLIIGTLRAMGLPLTWWFPFLAPLLVLYTITTGAATSAIRACIMALLALAAPFFKRRSDAISTLFAAALVILLFAPAQLGDLGFLLSFSAVAGLLAIPPVLDSAMHRWFRRDAWQLPGEEPPPKRRWRAAAFNGVRAFNVTLGAWIATAPLTLYFFNLVSPVALVMNLLVIPSAFVILLAGVLCLLFAPVSAMMAGIFNHAALAVALFLTKCIEWAAAIPGGHWFMRSPPLWGMAAWYGLLVVVAIMARRVRGAMLLGGLALALLAAGWGVWEQQRCRLVVLDVGSGNATLVQARGAAYLVDTGAAFRADDLMRALRREGVNRLQALILSHADAQHVGAAKAVMAQLPVAELWLPQAIWPSPLMNSILTEAAAAGIPVRRLQRGDCGHWPGGLWWEVLWPPTEMKMTCADDAALALRVARWGVSVIVAGDLGGEQEKNLARDGAAVAGSVLLAGRHGDAQANSAPWLDAVRPRDVVISGGEHLQKNLPDEEVMARLTARNIAIWRTDQQGTIELDWHGRPARWPATGYTLRAMRN